MSDYFDDFPVEYGPDWSDHCLIQGAHVRESKSAVEAAALRSISDDALDAFDEAGLSLESVNGERMVAVALQVCREFVRTGNDVARLDDAIDDLDDASASALVAAAEPLLSGAQAAGLPALVVYLRLLDRTWSVHTPASNDDGLLQFVVRTLRRCVQLARQSWIEVDLPRAIETRLAEAFSTMIPRFAALSDGVSGEPAYRNAVERLDFEARLAHPWLASIRRRVRCGLSAALASQRSTPSGDFAQWASFLTHQAVRAEWRGEASLHLSQCRWLTQTPLSKVSGDGAWGRARSLAFLAFAAPENDISGAKLLADMAMQLARQLPAHEGVQLEAMRACTFVVSRRGISADWAQGTRAFALRTAHRFSEHCEIRLQQIRILRTLPVTTLQDVADVAATLDKLSGKPFDEYLPIQFERARAWKRLAVSCKVDMLPAAEGAAERLHGIAQRFPDTRTLQWECAQAWVHLAMIQKDIDPAATQHSSGVVTELARRYPWDLGMQHLSAIARLALAWSVRDTNASLVQSQAAWIASLAQRHVDHEGIQLENARGWKFVAWAFRLDSVAVVDDAARRVASVARRFPAHTELQLQSAHAWRTLAIALLAAEVDLATVERAARRVDQIARAFPGDTAIQLVCAQAWRITVLAAKSARDNRTARQLAQRIDAIVENPLLSNTREIEAERHLAWEFVETRDISLINDAIAVVMEGKLSHSTHAHFPSTTGLLSFDSVLRPALRLSHDRPLN